MGQQEQQQVDLGPMPEPQVDPKEPPPGGPDALPDAGLTVPADPVIGDNPAVETQDVPEILQTGEDTATEATESPGKGTMLTADEEDPE